MLEPFIQFGEYIVMKYRGKPQIDMWFSWCFALALDVWKTRACEINYINFRSKGVGCSPQGLLKLTEQETRKRWDRNIDCIVC